MVAEKVDCCHMVTSVTSSVCVWYSDKMDAGHDVCVTHVILENVIAKNIYYDLSPILDYLRHELQSKCLNKVKCNTYRDMRVIYKSELLLMQGGYEDFEEWVPPGCPMAK